MAPQYFVIAGANPNEGAVITTDRLAVHEVYSPPLAKITSKDKGWFLVQTNDDQFNTPMDQRRPWATQQLAQMDRDQMTVSSMFNLMHTFPLMNAITVYTTLMVPKTGYYKTILPSEIPPNVGSTLGGWEDCASFDDSVRP